MLLTRAGIHLPKAISQKQWLKCFSSNIKAQPSITPNIDKDEFVVELLQAKMQSGKSFDEIASECGLTNVYTAQLFYNQAQLKEGTDIKLQKAVPALSDKLIQQMKMAPVRNFDEDILHEPHIYRMYEAITHYGLSLKALINEKFGDGIMSAVDFYMSVDSVKGKQGEDRVVVTMNGKFLPFNEQKVEDNTARLQ
eukprot:TRINITY_DN11887_c0_g2_i4.p3 TRINITY_DN11887_c0_g2~~TRINITY_DN11887_c0_g2_i4.p3  ORF type:complete len:195 (-),score=18.97 TRINITY_DN11887_c0_g2_i4:355-939(-)